MEQYCSWEFAQKANKWASRNLSRWRNDEYDAAHKAAQSELDPVKRAALFIKMNDLVCSDGYVHAAGVPAARVGGGQRSWWHRCRAGTTTCGPSPHWYRDA